MKSLLLVLLIVMAVHLKDGHANYTEEDFRYMKMIFCGK